MTHIRVRWAQLGGHVHCSVWSTEGGADTTHGRNGTLIFREAEFATFRDVMLIGGGPLGVVEFVHDPLQLQLGTPEGWRDVTEYGTPPTEDPTVPPEHLR